MKTCGYCGESFEKIGLHWYYNELHRPELDEEEIEILTGILMGDGTINRNSGNPRLVVEMTNKRYLDWLDTKLGNISCGVSIHRTSEENSERGVFGKSDGEYKETYVLKTVRNPEMSIFSDWYSSGNKVFPEQISLTPTILKHWYVCDGYFRNSSGHNSIEIGIENESNNREKINKYFTDAELPKPTWYDSGNSIRIRFTNEESSEIFDYMGKDVCGFSYKFPQR